MHSMHLSTAGHRTQNQAVTQEPLIKSFQCNDCTLIFKSKVYLFEHLNKVHGFDEDVSLRDAGLKNRGTNKSSTDNNCNSTGSHFECQRCDLKSANQDTLNEHDCLIGSGKPETETHLENAQEAARTKEISSVSSAMPTSKTKYILNLSKDLKTYKRPTMQAITNYFVTPSGSNGKPPMKLADSPALLDSTKGTLILQESPSDSSPNSSGVFKVTAKPTIDIAKRGSQRFLLDDRLQVTDLLPSKAKEQFRETVLKRTNNESSKSPPAKIAKSSKGKTKLQQKAHTSKQGLSSNTDFEFELSEDEEEKKVNLVFGDMESQEGPLQWNTCEDVPSSQRPQGSSHESAHTPCKEVKNAPSPQHPTSKGADTELYQCNNCTFSHKSAVVMHVHYQKSHPVEVVTIDKIKQSAHVMSHTSLPMMPEKCPNSVTIEESIPQKDISDSSKETRKKDEIAQQKKISSSLISPKHTPEASKTRSESGKTKKVISAEDRRKEKRFTAKRHCKMSAGMDSLFSSPNALYYCQFCDYSSTSIKSVLGHHNSKHGAQMPTVSEDILFYSAEVQKKKLQSEAKAAGRTSSSDFKMSKQVELCSEKELEHEEDEGTGATVTKFNAYACAEKLFYCQKCNYGNPSVKGILLHQTKVHQSIHSSKECIIEHTALIRAEIERSKSQEKEVSFSTNLPLPLMTEGDEDFFFCHFCNYRQKTVDQVSRHYFRKHRGFVARREQIHLYTSLILKHIQSSSRRRTTASQEVSYASLGEKNHKKTKKLGKVSTSSSVRASQTKRTLQCHRCSYNTQYVYLLRKHMQVFHKSSCTVMDVLRGCFKQGTLQSGYHCDMCVFSHKKAAAVYEHYQEKHPGRRLSLEYVTTRLYVGPETCTPSKKKPGISDGDDTDGSLPSQRSGQNETKTYSCRACPFKGSSMSRITDHYRAVHPWSVKEDGSVLDVISSKKQSANKQVEDDNETPVPFDTYQAALEFDHSPGSSEEAASSTRLKCPHSPPRFSTQRSRKTENLDEHQKEQVQIKTRVHVFKCPHCTYVNTNYHGILTHCQMRHRTLPSRANSLYVDEPHLYNWRDCLKRKGPDLKICGYMCKSCPEILATQEKLNKHCKKGHNETAEKTVPNMPKSAPKPPAVSKKKQYKTHSKQGSVSFLSKKIYTAMRCQYCSYSCTTKLVLDRHLHIRHRNETVSKAQASSLKCALCSSVFLRKKYLRSHYAKKHGKEALKFYAPLYKQVHGKPAPTVPDHPLTLQPEAWKPSTTAEEKKILIYKCPVCPYVNASHHGTLTHCQMKHPDLIARADDLQTDEVLVTNMVRCTVGKGSNERGYMCKKCPQIHVSLKKLKIHCESVHDQAEATASKHLFETEDKKHLEYGSRGSVLEAVSLKNKTSAVRTIETGLSQQLGTAETCQSNTASVQNKASQYKCSLCTYMGSCRRYLHCHYKKTHKLDPFTTYKLLEKYNRYKHTKPRNLPEAASEGCTSVKCKMCPNLKFDSSQLLINHYSTFHSSGCILDFIVLSKASRKTTGLYKCALCMKQMNGIKKLCHHLDKHRAGEKRKAKAAMMLGFTTTPQAKSIVICKHDEVPMAETVEQQAQCNVTPVQTFASPQSAVSSPSKPTDPEQPELESRQDKHSCKQCGRGFISLKGLRLHQRSHAALAAIKNKLHSVSTSALKHNINKYVLYKAGTMRPFLCSFCSYRTTVMGLWRCHFLKTHQDVIMDAAETGSRDKESAQRADMELSNSSEELNNLPELDEEPEITQKSLYLEHPDVQRQLNQYSLMAQAAAPSKANVQETKLAPNSLLHCEVCSFNTGYLSSMRRHYLNRHGKKILRCKDCSFFTGLRKTLEMHIETGHSTSQSESTHQRDLRCPFCLYQTKNKNNMIDHIVLHREERVVPIEVRRPKLSRYLEGIVFRCHKCTFTSGSAENLRLHMMRHDDIKPYKCRLCYFDCTRLSDLEAHLSDKHQVMRNHELVGQISLDQLEARVDLVPEEDEEPLSNLEYCDSEDIKTEEVVTDCNEDPHIRESVTPQIKGAHQKQEQDDKNGKEESPAKSSVLVPQYENTDTAIQEERELDPQEQAEIVLPDIARAQWVANIAGQKVGEGNNADIQYEKSSCPEKETNANQTQLKLKDSEGSSVTFTQQKEEAEEGSSTACGKIAEKAQAHKRHIKALKHRTLNIEAKVEDDILRHILLLDEDGGIRKRPKKASQDRTIKTEQVIKPEVDVLSEILLLDEEGSIALAHSQRNHPHTEAISALTKKSYRQANNIRAQEQFKVERHLLTLTPNCRQLKINHKEILGVSFTKCKDGQVQNQKNNEEVRDPYGEMPVLENEYLREEMHPLGSCKQEDQNYHLEQNQDKEDEIITEDESRRTSQGHQEGDGEVEADNPHVPKGAPTISDRAADVLCPEATKEKLFTCEFCGRNLMNGSELEHHVMRHGL